MNDLPFGFSSSSDDDPNKKDPDKKDRSSDSSGPNDPFGLGAMGTGGFDPNALGQMLSQLGSMISGMGAGVGSGGGGPVNYQVATSLARNQIGDFTPIDDNQRTAVADAVRLVEVWLDGATTLPAGVTTTTAWTPVQWLEETLPTWKTMCDPVAKQISGTLSKGLPAEAAALAGPMMGMMTQMGSMAFGSQLGQGLGQLAKEVLTSTDVGIPLAPTGTAVLLPEAIAAFSDGLEQPAQEIIVFLAAREAAHVRLFAHVPWLRQRLLSTVEEYANGISVDFSGIQEAAAGIDPMQLLSDPSKIEELMASGASFEPTTTPEQQAALNRLETLLALIEGWVEHVVAHALSDRIPSAPALAETMRRRRATGGPAEQTFATLVGLELRPRKLREAADLWERLLTAGDSASRDAVWAHPDLMPDGEDLDAPAAFVDRVISGGETGQFDDPIAELEKTIAAEKDAARKNVAEKNVAENDGTAHESATGTAATGDSSDASSTDSEDSTDGSTDEPDPPTGDR
ncbi:zinc-dependent metalloprotease [Williamsia sp. CHRR-6]|uniref:zinc-dependent metalloprotease n=1 Tax=Williamsia sp. CHRR-6 TaxID=2835871 RepID=UPI001BDA716B|nr:zinc-dependent metalloprotease [Williamsia sp. CHRR-6]MBT0565627.1 zinc-dependent metalloprotease [Williamsia sp. CHRR-6]